MEARWSTCEQKPSVLFFDQLDGAENHRAQEEEYGTAHDARRDKLDIHGA